MPTLTWNPVGDATSYIVTRDGTPVGSPAGTGFSDTSVPGEGAYAYRVIAVDGAGNQSAPSAAVSVTLDTTAPPAPSEAQTTGGSAAWTNAASVTITATAPGGSTLEHRTSTDAGATWSAAAAGASVVVSAEGETIVQFRALDAAGNASAWTPATPTDATTARIDRTAPSSPTGLTGGGATTTQPVIGWSAVNGIDRYSVRRDGVEVGTTSGTSFTDTALSAGGTYVYRVLAIDSAGNVSPPSSAVSVTYTPADVIPPNTTISAGAASPTNDSTPTFTLVASEPATFECSVNGGPWAACASPVTVGPLGDGAHTFAARARDDAGNLDASPAQSSLVVDTLAPPMPSLTATADTGIPLGAAIGRVFLTATTGGDAVRVVVTEGPRTVHDGASVTSLPDVVSDGVTHGYAAVAIDAAGNVSPTATASATTPDRTSPAQPAAPNGGGYPLALSWTPVADAAQYVVARDGATSVTSGTASATDAGALDAAAPPVPAGVSVNVLGSGLVALNWAAVTDAGTTYTMAVRAVDAIGNASPFSPGTPMTARSGLATYRVLLDGAPLVETVATAVDIEGLTPGTDHTLSLVAVDEAGNVSPASAPIALRIPADPSTAPRLRVSVSRAFVRPGVPVAFSAAVDGADAAGVSWVVEPGVRLEGSQVQHAYATAGRRTVRATVIGTGGQTASSVLEVIVDATPPTIDLASNGSRLTVTGRDADSGIERIEWTPESGGALRPLVNGAIPLTAGLNRITIRAIDRAGNISEMVHEAVGDTTAPRLTIRAPRMVVAARATVRVSLTDAGSGVAALEYGGRRLTRVPARLTVAAGRPVTVTAIDAAGNRSTARFTVRRAPSVPRRVTLVWNAREPRLAGAQRRLLRSVQMQLQTLRRLPARARPADRYTVRLSTTVATYQRRAGLRPTGTLDWRTRARIQRDLAKTTVVIRGR